MIYEVIKKFLKLSASTEKAALEIYERLPLSLRYRVLYGPVFLRWLKVLKEAEEWDQERLYAFQFEQTRNLLMNAMAHVPYYKNLFRRYGYQPEKMQSFDDFRTLPFLDKEIVRDHSTALIDERLSLKYLSRKSTGGSSGIPVTIYRSRANEAAFLAFRTNILDRIHYKPTSKDVMFWAEVQVGNKSVPYKRYGHRLILSVRYLAGKWIQEYLDMIRQFEPEYILGYSSVLAFLSNFIKLNRISPYRNIKAVIPYSETLYDWQRKLIEESFGCRVFSMYGMTEHAAIGGECEHSTGMHLHPLYGITEFEECFQGYKEIVVTGFTNYEMPFIRYRTGDLVSEHSAFCSACGRTHITVGTIEGRSHSFLIGKNGEVIPSLSSWIGIFHNVLQYQFVQKKRGVVCLNMVPTKAFSESNKDDILHELDTIFARRKDAIKVELNFVDHIPKTSSGKTNMVEQQLDLNSLVARNTA